MRVIKKKISLEQFKSRVPTFIDSFDDVESCMVSDSNSRFIDFNASGNEEKLIEYYPMANYGLYPCDVIIPNDIASLIDKGLLKTIYSTSEITSYSDIAYSKYDYCITPSLEYYAMSYGILNKIYHFFLKYNKLLYDASKCGHLISSATQYWEIFDKQYTNQLYYQELDETFKRYGGKVKLGTNFEGYASPIIDGMDDYVVNKIFKTFKIPQDYVKYWHTDILYPIDAIKWKHWFIERDELYKKGKVDCNEQQKVENCDEIIITQTYDCEDCERYKRLGGWDMSQRLTAFVNTLNDIITSSASTSIDLKIDIPTSIDDMGEYTIFSEEWKGGINYSSNVCNNNFSIDKCGGSKTTNGSTTVVYDNDIWILTDCGKSGFTYTDCDTYEFDSSAWTKYIENHKNDIEITQPKKLENIYAYDENNVAHMSTSTTVTPEFATEVATKIKYDNNNKIGFIVYDEEPLPLIKYKYIEFRHEFYFVKEDFKGEYVYYKNKKYYVDNTTNTVTIDKIPYISNGLTIQINDAERFVFFKNQYIKERNNNLFVIDDYVYPIIDGYFKYNNCIFFIQGNKIVNYGIFYDYVEDLTNVREFGNFINSGSTNQNTFGYYLNDNDVVLYKPFEVYNFNTLTGNTQSQLTGLKTKNVACDDMGYELLGYFEVKEDSKFAQPKENTILDLYYHVNNVNRLSQVSENDSEYVLWGDLLYDMVFYYKDNEDNITSDLFSVKNFNNENLITIEEVKNNWCTKHKVEFDRDIQNVKSITDKLCCKFTYYVGAILKRGKKDVTYQLYQQDSSFDGIKYEEECELILKQQDFHLDSKNVYKINYYELKQNTNMTQYGNSMKEIPMATFKTMMNYNNVPNDNDISFSQKNSLIYSPIFREEYKMGSSMKENIVDTIYIERPIIKPTEKNLQLLDVLTLESLEEYGNGKIKIIKNS